MATASAPATSADDAHQEIDADQLDARLQQISHALQLNDKLINHVESRRAQLVALGDELDFASSGAVADCEPTTSSSTTVGSRAKAKPVSLLPFFKPYFRDAIGISGPRIYDPTSIEPSLVNLLQTPKPIRQWNDEEKEIVLKEVRSQYSPHYHKDLISRLEALLEEAPEVKPPELINQINNLSTKLALAASAELEPEPWSTLIDWLVVAKQLPLDRSSEDCELMYNNSLHADIKKGPWTHDEDQRLVELYNQYGNDWDQISGILKGRLPWQCCGRFQAEFNPSLRRRGRIQGDEADYILSIINQYKFGSFINWNNVSCLIEGRSIQQVQHFYRKLNNPTVVKKWNQLEDKMVLVGVKLFGNRWGKIAQYLPLRNNRQIRERFKNQLEFAQLRKFGHWIEEEDEMILEMSTKYVKLVGGVELINFPEIQKQYFPNRNTYQVYRRYMYLRRFLPETIFPDPSSSPSNGDSNPQLLSNLTKITRNRHRGRGAPVSLRFKLPADADAQQRYLIEGRKKLEKLASQTVFDVICSEDEDDEEEPLEDPFDEYKEYLDLETPQVKRKPRKNERKAVVVYPKIPKVPELKSMDAVEELQNWEYDQLISEIMFLNDIRYTPKGTFLTKLDLQVNDIIALVIFEVVDPKVDFNLTLKLKPDVEQTKEAEPEEEKITDAEPIESFDCSICSLDTMRFFLTCFSGFSVAPADTGPSLSDPKSLLPPNASTTFGYDLLKVMSKSMIIKLTESDDADVAAQQQEIIASDQFQELRTMFLSLFTWPALLAKPDIGSDERISEVLLKNRPIQEEKAPEPEVVQPVRRGKGRPKKRKFYYHQTDVDIDFFRLRAYQATTFMMTIRSDLVTLLKDQYPFTASKYWPEESRAELQERVKLFIDAVWISVDTNFMQREAKAKRVKLVKEEKAAARPPRPVKPKPVSVVEENQVRRSSRSSRATAVSYKELAVVGKTDVPNKSSGPKDSGPTKKKKKHKPEVS